MLARRCCPPLLPLALVAGCAGTGAKAPGGDGAGAGDTGRAGGADCAAGALSCNGEDDDCDGVTDEPGERLLEGWRDEDGDGHGGGDPLTGCAALSAAVWAGGDCDDGDPAIHPGAWDAVGDGVDADCSGEDRACGAGPTQMAVEGDLVLTDGRFPDGRSAADGLAAACARGDHVAGAVVIAGGDRVDLADLGCFCAIDDGLELRDLPALARLDGLAPGLWLGRSLRLAQLPRLGSVAALGAVHWRAPLRDPSRLLLQDLPVLATLGGLEGIEELDDLGISGEVQADLGALAGLRAVHESLDIRDTSLPGLGGLEGLVSAGELRIENAPELDSLAPLAGLQRLRFLTLRDLDLGAMDGEGAGLGAFTGLARIDRRLALVEVAGLRSLAGLDQLAVLGGLELVGNPELVELHGLPAAVTGLDGDLVLRGNPGLVDAAGLEGLTWLGGSLTLGGAEGPTALTSLAGLGGLRFIGGDLAVVHAPGLATLAGLSALEELGGDLWATTVYSAAPGPFSFAGLGALHTVHGQVALWDHATAASLAGLEGLRGAGGLSLEGNGALGSLAGVGGLTALGDLRVVDNAVLDDISALYQSAPPAGSVCIQLAGDGAEPAAWLASIGRVNGC